MPAQLTIGSRRVWMHKGVIDPDFGALHVLSNDPWAYVELFLKRAGSEDSLAYWLQARRFADASFDLGPDAAPLTLYYSFLNAAKALLSHKALKHGDRHGVAGSEAPTPDSRAIDSMRSRPFLSDDRTSPGRSKVAHRQGQYPCLGAVEGGARRNPSGRAETKYRAAQENRIYVAIVNAEPDPIRQLQSGGVHIRPPVTPLPLVHVGFQHTPKTIAS